VDTLSRDTLVVGLFTVRAPHPLEPAGFGVEDDDAAILVAVGDEDLVGRRPHEICAEIEFSVSELPCSSSRGDLQEKLPVVRTSGSGCPGRPCCREPDVALWSTKMRAHSPAIGASARPPHDCTTRPSGSNLDDRRRGNASTRKSVA